MITMEGLSHLAVNPVMKINSGTVIIMFCA